MGRGLSELQKAILKLSWDELEDFHKARDEIKADPTLMAEWLEIYVGHVKPVPEKFAIMAKDNWLGLTDTNAIFIRFYGWNPRTDRFGNHHFSKSEIGSKAYMAAYIAVRKSLNRLVARGLIHDDHGGRYSGYSLTTKGQDLMAKLGR